MYIFDVTQQALGKLTNKIGDILGSKAKRMESILFLENEKPRARNLLYQLDWWCNTITFAKKARLKVHHKWKVISYVLLWLNEIQYVNIKIKCCLPHDFTPLWSHSLCEWEKRCIVYQVAFSNRRFDGKLRYNHSPMQMHLHMFHYRHLSFIF